MKYDVAIIGGGPAGLSAAIFACNAGLKTICFEKLVAGGQMALSYEISNYPGMGNVLGFDLSEKMLKHATDAGLNMEYTTVDKICKLRSGFEIVTKQGSFQTKKLIIASGSKVKKLGLNNEEQLTGKGVSYCASCDGRFYKNKTVAIVGGGDSAFEYVEYLRNLAKKVYLINRTEKFKAKDYKVEKAKTYKNVEIITSASVKQLNGKDVLKSVVLKLKDKEKTLKVDGVFIAIGHEPDLNFLDFEIERDKAGYIIVDENQKTSVKNVYACGDIVSKHFKQVITACADGARAGNSCIGD